MKNYKQHFIMAAAALLLVMPLAHKADAYDYHGYHRGYHHGGHGRLFLGVNFAPAYYAPYPYYAPAPGYYYPPPVAPVYYQAAPYPYYTPYVTRVGFSFR